MNLIEKSITCDTETLTLTNQRTVFWEKQRVLIISDLHLGKGAHFRRHGIAIPQHVSAEDLAHLQRLIHHYQPLALIIVGDFVHANQNSEVDLFSHWRASFPNTEFILVKGNHDRLSASSITKIGIDTVCDELYVDTMLFRHEFEASKDSFQITGHIHPGVVLKLPTKRALRFPCYVQTDRQLILPAFSRFTGLDTKSIPPEAIRYAFYEEDIFVV